GDRPGPRGDPLRRRRPPLHHRSPRPAPQRGWQRRPRAPPAPQRPRAPGLHPDDPGDERLGDRRRARDQRLDREQPCVADPREARGREQRRDPGLRGPGGAYLSLLWVFVTRPPPRPPPGSEGPRRPRRLTRGGRQRDRPADMARWFNIAGPCSPERNYMLSVMRRLPRVRRLI